jgi:hypothetical protein
VDIKMDLPIGRDSMDWIDPPQDRDQWRTLVNMVMNFRGPSNIGKILSGCTTGCFPRRAQLDGVKFVN